MALGTSRWLASVARRLAPPASGTDADLLERFAGGRDATAFAAILERHGPAVRGVCRARLGETADADDAFQVVFYVLARDAARIRTRESLAGWLTRVAVLTALKTRRANARRRAGELPDGLTVLAPDLAERGELAGIVAEELAALPDKFRAVLVLSCVEERSNTEAAEILGCPRGTVDSRLATAKARLRQRLVRRGVTLGLAASLEATLARLGAAAPGWGALADGVLVGALHYARGSVEVSTLTLVADGVQTTMTNATKLLAAGLLATGVMTTAGFGLYHGGADGAPQAAKQPDKPKPAKPEAEKPPAQKPPAEGIGAKVLPNEAAVRATLAAGMVEIQPPITLRDLIHLLDHNYGLLARLDLPAFKRLNHMEHLGAMGALPAGGDAVFVAHRVNAGDPVIEQIVTLYDYKLVFPVSKGMSVADVLADAVAQLPGKCGYRVRGNQILIGPAFQPATIPNKVGEEGENLVVSRQRLQEQILGEPVSLAADQMPLSEVIKELRRQTGANIVVAPPADLKPSQLVVSVSFDDVRLYGALEVIGEQFDLKPVFLHNVYYLTTFERAEVMQKRVNRELFGEERKPLAVPAGYVTDGLNYYRNPGNLKPVTAEERFGGPGGALGGGIGGGSGGIGGGSIPGVVPAEPKPAPPIKK